MKFSGVILQWVEFFISLLIFEWTLQQCSATVLPLTYVCVVNSNETRAPNANPPNSAQLEGTPYHSPKLHLGSCSSVGMRRGTDRQTQRHTDGRGQYTFCLGYMPHAKCNKLELYIVTMRQKNKNVTSLMSNMFVFVGLFSLTFNLFRRLYIHCALKCHYFVLS